MIIILTIAPNAIYVAGVALALIAVMILNLFAMLYARRILKAVGMMPLQIIGSVLSVLQVALGVQMIHTVVESGHYAAFAVGLGYTWF